MSKPLGEITRNDLYPTEITQFEQGNPLKSIHQESFRTSSSRNT